ncbi:MAG: DUF3107 family protein [Acidimicrobiia bacterium]|nr:DUF3107 family protein [Acidimicrobiia bacterium]
MDAVIKVRIGMQGARELEIEVDDAETIRTDVERAITDREDVVWVTDTKGNRFGLVTRKVAFVQIDDAADRTGIGFGL